MSPRRYEEMYNMSKKMMAAAVFCGAIGAAGAAVAGDKAKNWPSPMHDDGVLAKVMLDRLEACSTDAGHATYWEGQAWVGSDLNKLWLKTEGNVVKGSLEEADVEAFYSRAVAPFWDFQAGLRHDFKGATATTRDWAAIGFKGLAPYRFEVDATAYVGNGGRTAARLKAEYDLLITQRLILMPELELSAFGKDDPRRSVGAGLSSLDLGLRLRYEIRRELAPYVGVVWTRKFGGTAEYARADGEAVRDTQWLLGLRAWW
jgi:copper resistance protein B